MSSAANRASKLYSHKLRKKDPKDKMTSKKLLNRLLSMHIRQSNHIFNNFEARVEYETVRDILGSKSAVKRLMLTPHNSHILSFCIHTQVLNVQYDRRLRWEDVLQKQREAESLGYKTHFVMRRHGGICFSQKRPSYNSRIFYPSGVTENVSCESIKNRFESVSNDHTKENLQSLWNDAYALSNLLTIKVALLPCLDKLKKLQRSPRIVYVLDSLGNRFMGIELVK